MIVQLKDHPTFEIQIPNNVRISIYDVEGITKIYSSTIEIKEYKEKCGFLKRKNRVIQKEREVSNILFYFRTTDIDYILIKESTTFKESKP